MRHIYFFNGWSMDENIFRHMNVGDDSKLTIINYPYTIENVVLGDTDRTSEIVFLAWSFGVTYLNAFLAKFPQYQNFLSIGINGTPEIIGKYGITPKMYDYTLKNLTLVSRRLFFKNMGVDKDFVEPSVTIERAKEALLEFKKMPRIANHLKVYIVGNKDRIIPFPRQKKYFREHAIPYKVVEGEHYLFQNFHSLLEIVSMGEAML